MSDQILRTYAIISSLKANLPETYDVEEKWGREFNAAVGKLESALGTSLEEFKLPEGEFGQSVSGGNYITGAVYYRAGLWCRRSSLMHKIDSILAYFTGLQSGEERRIGFIRPDE